jgi:hypothetical protein
MLAGSNTDKKDVAFVVAVPSERMIQGKREIAHTVLVFVTHAFLTLTSTLSPAASCWIPVVAL